MLFIYEPIMGIKTETNYKELEGITGLCTNTLASNKSKGRLVKCINCYIIDDKTPKSKLRELREKFTPENEVWLPCELGGRISNYGRYIDESGKLRTPYKKYNKKLMLYKINYKVYIIHQLVASHFLENPNGYNAINHKDGDFKNVHADNLEYLDNKTVARINASKSRRTPVLKIDAKTNEVLDEYKSCAEAGRKNYLHRETIRQVLNRETRTAGGFIWIIDKEAQLLSEI